jgi:hypothetical protein
MRGITVALLVMVFSIMYASYRALTRAERIIGVVMDAKASTCDP